MTAFVGNAVRPANVATQGAIGLEACFPGGVHIASQLNFA